MLVPNQKGNYSFLRGISPYSAGVVANGGFEIERARLATPLSLERAFPRMDERLRSLGLAPQALCGVELRSPLPFSFQSFRDFNAAYVEFLQERDILLDGLNPVARTNVAPEIAAPTEPVVYAFSYVAPSESSRPTFIVAGAGELPEGSLDPTDVVRRDDTSAEALQEKARFVLQLMDARVRGLGVNWEAVTAIDVYTIHSIAPFLASDLLPATQNAPHGLTWHYTRPPITSIEYEMDVRGCAREIVLDL